MQEEHQKLLQAYLSKLKVTFNKLLKTKDMQQLLNNEKLLGDVSIGCAEASRICGQMPGYKETDHYHLLNSILIDLKPALQALTSSTGIYDKNKAALRKHEACFCLLTQIEELTITAIAGTISGEPLEHPLVAESMSILNNVSDALREAQESLPETDSSYKKLGEYYKIVGQTMENIYRFPKYVTPAEKALDAKQDLILQNAALLRPMQSSNLRETVETLRTQDYKDAARNLQQAAWSLMDFGELLMQHAVKKKDQKELRTQFDCHALTTTQDPIADIKKKMMKLVIELNVFSEGKKIALEMEDFRYAILPVQEDVPRLQALIENIPESLAGVKKRARKLARDFEKKLPPQH